jgi:flagellar biogenesis protein FliO
MGHLGNHQNNLQVRHKRCKQGSLVRLEQQMLWTILVVLFVLWLLGMVTSHTFGGFIHILLLVAVVIFLFNLIQGRRRTA